MKQYCRFREHHAAADDEWRFQQRASSSGREESNMSHDCRRKRYMKSICALFRILLVLVFVPTLTVKAAGRKDDLDKIGDRHIARRSLIPQPLETRMGKAAAARLERSNQFVQEQDFNAYVSRV